MCEAYTVHDLRSLGKLWLLFVLGVCVCVCAGIRPGAVTRTFPSPWPPMLFPPRLQRLDLVKRPGCTDLNSSYSPQKTLAFASQPTFFFPAYSLSVQWAYALFVFKSSFLYIRKLRLKGVIPFPAVIPQSSAVGTMTEFFLLAEWLTVMR